MGCGGDIVSLTSASKVQPQGAPCSEGGRGFVILVLKKDAAGLDSNNFPERPQKYSKGVPKDTQIDNLP